MNGKRDKVELSDSQCRRSMNCAVISSVGAIVGVYSIGGNVLNLFALKLGAGEVYLGVLSFAFMVPTLFRVFTMNTIERVGKRKVLLIGFYITAVLALPFVAVALLAGTGWLSAQWCLAIVLVAMFLRVSVGQMASTGWFPLLQDVVPSDMTGRFFARIRITWQTAGFLTLLGTAWYLGEESSWGQFAVVFGVGTLAFVLRAVALIPVVERPARAEEHTKIGVGQRFREVLAERHYRVLTLYILFYMAAATAVEPFKVKMMKDLGYDDRTVLIATAMTALGAILSLRFWGKLADRFGNRSIFSISHVGMIVVTLFWLLVDKSGFGMGMIFALYLLASVFNSGNGIAQTRYILHTVPSDKQNHINIINIVSNVTAGVAPLLAGLLLWLTRGFGFASGAVSLNNYHLLFVLTALLFVVPHVLRKTLTGTKETSTSQVISFMSNTIRNAFQGYLSISGKSDDEDGDAQRGSGI
ncbi:MAG: MFS transporter [Sedimentisphaerales bacterium]|nr:MFS transporter [Sedimentisphaerales bacterium]